MASAGVIILAIFIYSVMYHYVQHTLLLELVTNVCRHINAK